MKIRLFLPPLVVLLALPACGPAAPDFGCTETLSALAALQREIGEIPQNLVVDAPLENGTEFDPSRYFEVFPHLSMQAGYLLDYVYTFDGMGGYPTLFARPEASAPFLSWADLPADMDSFLDHVRVDDSPEGFLQFVMFSMKAEQFYLYWHAGYNDHDFVCSPEAVKVIIASQAKGDFGIPMTIGEKLRALSIDSIEPVVTLTDETVEVQVTTFTLWGGFYRQTYTIQRSFPHTILEQEEELLVPYDCGIMF